MADVDALIDRWRRVPSPVADAALAAVVAAVTVTAILVDDANDPERHMTAWAWGLQAVQFVALVWRRRAPGTVAIVVSAAALLHGVANLPDPPIVFAMALAIYSAGAYSRRRVSLAVAALVTIGGLVVIVSDRQSDAADVAVNYLVGITSWVVGDAMRSQRERARWLAAHQQVEAERAAADERVRIARDLHDIVAHHLSVVVVQTEAAQEVLAVDPSRAEGAMAAVGDTARTALGELRQALGALRSDPQRAPQPDLADLDALVESVRRAGVAVDLHRADDGRPVSAVVSVTAYRIVQEALTNVLRHADARHARVEVGADGDALVVCVTDDGHGPARSAAAAPPEGGGGQGLVGMRERVAAVGGDLVTGQSERGGFVVRARLPLGVDAVRHG